MRELLKILWQLGLAATSSQGAENITHAESRASNTRLAKANRRVDRDAIEPIDDASLNAETVAARCGKAQFQASCDPINPWAMGLTQGCCQVLMSSTS